jgi:hypothetical protein
MSYENYYGKKRKRVTKVEIRKRNKTRKYNQEAKLYSHILSLKRENPERYSSGPIYIGRQVAKDVDGDYWWAKCKRGHVCERPVSANSCTVCSEVAKAVRDKRIKESVIKLTKEEEEELWGIYNTARHLTKTTGIQYHVDHIRPIAAGGLHHPDNLQVITAQENLYKGSEYKGKRTTYSHKEKTEARKIIEEKIGFTRQETSRVKHLKKEKTFYNDGSLLWIAFIVFVIFFAALF